MVGIRIHYFSEEVKHVSVMQNKDEILIHDLLMYLVHVSIEKAADLFAHLAASTPAPQQSSSSDCPPSQASDLPTDHSPVDPEGNSSKEEQSVSADPRGLHALSIRCMDFIPRLTRMRL